MVLSIAMYHKQFNYKSAIHLYTNDQTIVFRKIRLNISDLFAHSSI